MIFVKAIQNLIDDNHLGEPEFIQRDDGYYRIILLDCVGGVSFDPVVLEQGIVFHYSLFSYVDQFRPLSVGGGEPYIDLHFYSIFENIGILMTDGKSKKKTTKTEEMEDHKTKIAYTNYQVLTVSF